MFEHFKKIVLRSPLYSYADIINKDGITVNLEELVKQKLKDPVFLESLYWSSPYLHQLALTYMAGELSESKEKDLLHTLKKYSIRACTRSTPYGIFAGCAIAEIDIPNRNKEEMKPIRKVRVDMGLLQQIVHRIETDPKLWEYLHFKTNPSLYKLPNYYRFMESIMEGGKIQYQISSLFYTDLLSEIIAICEKKPIPLQKIFLIIGENVSNEDKLSFVKELVDTQFLVSEMQLALTSDLELERCNAILQRIAQKNPRVAEDYIDLIKTLQAVLMQFEYSPLGELPLSEIKNIEEKLRRMGISVVKEHLFHADLLQTLPEQFFFSTKEISELNKAINILGKLSSSSSSHEADLTRFKKLFSEKYETQEISLSEVLDAEHGIGFPPMASIGNISNNSLTDKLSNISKERTKISIKTEKNQVWLQEKIELAGSRIFKEGIELCDQELTALENHAYKLPNQVALLGTMLSSGKIILHSVGGAHANALLGRFAYLDTQIELLCKDIAKKEAQINPDCILAEILYTPEGRTANIARRPVLSDYEIPILASSVLNYQKQLPMQDLMISIVNGQIVLRSKKLNKRVIPRLSNAHNYMNSEGAHYKFLASLQHQGKVGLQINLGTWAQGKRFLPRITYRQIILHRASWMLYEKDIQDVLKSSSPIASLRRYLERWHIPKYVCLGEGDNELFIDTSSDDYLLLLLGEIKKSHEIKLIEWLHSDVVGENRRVRQFILPLMKKIPQKQQQLVISTEEINLKRVFEPGTEWLYFKLYCGAHLSDILLKDAIKPAIMQLLNKGIIDKAFFIRYADPHYHIRLRLHITERAMSQKLSEALECVHALLNPFVTNRTIWKVQLDTYQREIERYGQSMMMLSEIVFFQDSLLYFACLEEDSFIEDEYNDRFLTALKNLDKWLTLFALSLEERIVFCEEMSEAFAAEFSPKLKPQFDKQYREMKSRIVEFMSGSQYEEVFNKRSLAIKKYILSESNLADYIHMSINRWFQTEQRLMEYMVYVFGAKYYKYLGYLKN